MDLRQATASQEVLLGQFLDDDDGVTPKTGLSLANTDIKLFKSGATARANKNSGGATEDSGGYYYTVLDATDTGTAGLLEITVNFSDCLEVRAKFRVLSAVAYDALYADTGVGLRANVITMANDVVTAAVIASAAIDADAVATDAFGALELAAGAVTEIAAGLPTAAGIADAVWDEAASGHVAIGSFGALGQIAHAGTAQAGGASTITLASGASATDDAYNGRVVHALFGTGNWQTNIISDYVGATKVATVQFPWSEVPDNTTAYVVA